ncbi:MAG TPA: hypothetical protein IAC14_14930 [Candidatus Scybalomonas excrementigallinarum]|jgi:hypothetical protein|nr:hypothetical protein [Candidatus Scybalomonas excrementigallinarum]
MEVAFIRYRYLEKSSVIDRWLHRTLPKKWLQKWLLRKKKLKKENSAEGELKGIEVELPFEQECAIKMGEELVWRFIEEEIREQKRQYGSVTFLLKGELFSLYCRQESNFACYPYHLSLYSAFDKERQEEQKDHIVCMLLNRRNYVGWMKFFFIKELTEYYRVLYGIRKKVLKLVIIEGKIEETKRVISLVSNNLNYMIVKTNQPSVYETLAKEIYEETGLSIVFLPKEKKEKEGTEKIEEIEIKEKEVEEREIEEIKEDSTRIEERISGQNTTIEIDLNDLYPKASNLRITQRGIWIDQEVLTAILMEQTMHFDGTVVEEKLEEWKENYGLYLRKIV